jgi:hypothetical protein
MGEVRARDGEQMAESSGQRTGEGEQKQQRGMGEEALRRRGDRGILRQAQDERATEVSSTTQELKNERTGSTQKVEDEAPGGG